MQMQWGRKHWQAIAAALCWALVGCAIAGCSNVSASAQERLFSKYQLEFLDEYRLTDVPETVGGLSGIAFDPREGRYYAISDDRSDRAPARFYTLTATITPENKFANVTVESMTTLKDAAGQTVPPGRIDPEGIAVAPGGTLFIASEGGSSADVSPFIAQFNRADGKFLQSLPLAPRYLPAEDGSTRGVQNNLGFESLTLEHGGRTALESDPYRVFAATEGALVTDKLPPGALGSTRVRLLHYLVGPIGAPMPISEHLYLLEPAPLGSIVYGLSELLAIPPAGHFLALERGFGLGGFSARLFEVVIANATDIRRVESLSGDLGQLVPVQKKPLLDFADLDLEIDNLEGMVLGPPLANGSQSLILLSDNNFSDRQVTQLLLFRLAEAPRAD
ncbi:MAG: esterase-like activity of phytase family protein [Cyanobacteria bacterium J06641_5]